MIRARKIPGHDKQYYLYIKGKYDGWYTCGQLFLLPECVVPKDILSKRLFTLTRYGSTEMIKNILDCLTTKSIKNAYKKKKQGVSDYKTYEIEPYLWPAGSLSHTVR